MTYNINTNPAFNSVEITFDGKPCEAIRTALKELRFRWHNVKKVWYGYTDEETARKAIEAAENGNPIETKTATPKAKPAPVNEYGVKVGDIFVSSWGYEQTNVDFYQVIALVGKHSVRVREVAPEIINEEACSSMSCDREYKMTNELLPPVRSIFIKDQENGDLKRINLGHDKDPEKAKANCYILIDGRYHAYKCNGETQKEYVSWYA